MKLQLPGFGWIRVDSITEYTGGAIAMVQTIQVTADVSGSLNNKYFHIYTANDAIGYTVWFNVSSSGTAPEIGLSVNVEVTLSANDSVGTVATAVQTAINALAGFSAIVNSEGDRLQVTNAGTGTATQAHGPVFETQGTQKDLADPLFTYTIITGDGDAYGQIALPSSLVLYRIIGSKPNNYMEFNHSTYNIVPFKRNSIDIVVTEHQLMLMTLED